jgi:lipopolysaccharide transport system ATP-binding protein
MSDFAIKVEGLSKQYRLGDLAGPKNFLADLLRRRPVVDPAPVLGPPAGLPEAGAAPEGGDIVWALKDISFAVAQGEAVGIVGHNGSGKSTLLKILSRVTEPTHGRARVRGRVGSLLEVGTGFNPDLTGRENIFFSGALLGMSQVEIRAKLDQIVEFSGVSHYLDTPIKRYSSGMVVRLAFAVAAHLEPEILLIDEVLAVGDIRFQRKCLGKMNEVAGKGGRTVLFVSHNMQAIRAFCSRVIMLGHGRVVADGPTEEVVGKFLHSMTAGDGDLETRKLADRLNRTTGRARFVAVDSFNAAGDKGWRHDSGAPARIVFQYKVVEPVPGLSLMFSIRSAMDGSILTTCKDVVSASPLSPGATGTSAIEIASLTLRPGDYVIDAMLADPDGAQFHDVVATKEVDLPFLTIVSSEDDYYRRLGVFSLDYRIISDFPDGPRVG